MTTITIIDVDPTMFMTRTSDDNGDKEDEEKDDMTDIGSERPGTETSLQRAHIYNKNSSLSALRC